MARLKRLRGIGQRLTWSLGLMLLASMLRKTYYRPAKTGLTPNVWSVHFTTSAGGEEMNKSGNKNYLTNHGTLGIHVSLEELKRYHSLTPEQKRTIRTIVKTLIYNPQLLNESVYLLKFLTAKAVSPYVCPLCLTPFSSSLSLKQHIRYAEHTKVCLACGKEFQKTEALLDHVCKKHNICVS